MILQTPGDEHDHYSVAVGSRSGSVGADAVCFVVCSIHACGDPDVSGYIDGKTLVLMWLMSVAI